MPTVVLRCVVDLLGMTFGCINFIVCNLKSSISLTIRCCKDPVHFKMKEASICSFTKRNKTASCDILASLTKLYENQQNHLDVGIHGTNGHANHG